MSQLICYSSFSDRAQLMENAKGLLEDYVVMTMDL